MVFSLIFLHLQEHKTGHAIGMIRPLILMFWSFVQICMFCDLGENVCCRFQIFNKEIYDSDWYSLPIKIQHMIPTIILTTQKAMILYGFGNVPCTHEALKTVSLFSIFWTVQNKIMNIFLSFFFNFRQLMLPFPTTWFFDRWNEN